MWYRYIFGISIISSSYVHLIWNKYKNNSLECLSKTGPPITNTQATKATWNKNPSTNKNWSKIKIIPLKCFSGWWAPSSLLFATTITLISPNSTTKCSRPMIGSTTAPKAFLNSRASSKLRFSLTRLHRRYLLKKTQLKYGHCLLILVRVRSNSFWITHWLFFKPKVIRSRIIWLKISSPYFLES